jgi:deazaflavin-dependent oxidoreductase (nitroreductase family)
MALDPDSAAGRAVQRMAGSPAFARVGPRIVPTLDRLAHRLTGGRVMVSRMMLPCLVLTSTGRRSGRTVQTPLATVPLGDDLYVVGSNFGREHHPAWSWNLLANPDARVSYGARDFDVRAELLDHEEKAGIWPRLVEKWPLFDLYVQRSGRDLRVFRLVRT